MKQCGHEYNPMHAQCKKLNHPLTIKTSLISSSSSSILNLLPILIPPPNHLQTLPLLLPPPNPTPPHPPPPLKPPQPLRNILLPLHPQSLIQLLHRVAH